MQPPPSTAASPPGDSANLPLRVLFLCHYFPKPGNELIGPWALAQALALKRAGIDLTVLAFTSWIPRVLGRLGIKPVWALCPRTHEWNGLVVHYPRWGFYPVAPVLRATYRRPAIQEAICWLTARRTLDHAVATFRPDVIFAHHSLYNGCMARRLHDRYGIPYIITDHHFGEIRDCAKLPQRHRIFGRAVSGAHACIAYVPQIRDALEQVFPEVRTRTIRLGSEPIPDSMRERPRPSEIQGRLVVFSAGMFYEQKGFPLLVRAFARIAAKHPSAVLRIAGGGSTDVPAVQAAVRETGMEDRVQLLGPVAPERVKQEMVWSDLFAMIGWNELYGAVFVEAASAGRPIVWTRDGGINDVLQDGVHGMAVESKSIDSAADTLDRLLSNAADRERMGQASLELFESELTWEASAREMEKLFREAASTREAAALAGR
jgi:glycosyltransferase involved in cell wall biosynthesis